MQKDAAKNEVNAKRYEITYDGDKIYVVISHDARELFISSINDQRHKVAAIYDSLTRMTSAAWQHNSTENIIKQLQKASRSIHDLPGMIAELLSREI